MILYAQRVFPSRDSKIAKPLNFRNITPFLLPFLRLSFNSIIQENSFVKKNLKRGRVLLCSSNGSYVVVLMCEHSSEIG